MTLDELTMDEFYTRRINELAVALKAEHQARMAAERERDELKAQLTPEVPHEDRPFEGFNA